MMSSREGTVNRPAAPSVSVLGVTVHAVTQDELFDFIARAIAERRKVIVANHNLHSVYLYHRHPAMRRYYEMAGLVHVDGMPIVYWARLRGFPLAPKHRLAYIDFLPPLLNKAAGMGWRVFYLGGKPGVAERAAEKFRAQFSSLQIETHDGYFQDDQAVLRRIRAFDPDLLLVGMGMPRQEEWVARHYDQISARVVMNCGAAFDYFAGEKATPPRWLSSLGMEWAFRLLTEPRRLARRYLVEPWLMIPIFVRDLMGGYR